MELTKEQKAAMEAAIDWYKSGPTQPFVLAGYAGTGKTTVLAELVQRLQALNIRPQVCAPTGKAASVLGDKLNKLGVKGSRPTTLHRAIYEPPREVADNLVFDRKVRIAADLLLVDEASMVSRQLMSDITAFGVPVILVGDDYQLPPVDGKSAFLARKPDVKLVNVVRQASDNPILRLATTIRSGEHIPSNTFVKNELGTVGIDYKEKGKKWAQAFYDSAMRDNTTILCYRNKTRVALNQMVRAEYSWEHKDHPVAGEKLVILVNRPDIDLYNGEVHRLTAPLFSTQSTYNTKFRYACFDGNIKEQPLYMGCFNQERAEICCTRDPSGHLPISADFGYALTVHKAQGSEWANVLVIDEYPEENADYRRWLYTAVTRAKRNLLITKR